MNTETHQLILDHLRNIRQDLALIKADVRELKDGHIGIRDDIHALRGDFRRQERAMAVVEADLDRIKVRLDLSDS